MCSITHFDRFVSFDSRNSCTCASFRSVTGTKCDLGSPMLCYHYPMILTEEKVCCPEALYVPTWPSHVCSVEVCCCHGYHSAHVATTWLVTPDSRPTFLCELWLPNLNLQPSHLFSTLSPSFSCRSFVYSSSLVPPTGSSLPTSLSLSPCPFSPAFLHSPQQLNEFILQGNTPIYLKGQDLC